MFNLRTLPPAAAPIGLRDIVNGLYGIPNKYSEIERFRNEIKRTLNVKYCFVVSSGKAALTIILKALKSISPKRTDVLIPSYTCYSVPSAVVRAGLNIKLCDTDPQTLDFEKEQFRQLFIPTEASDSYSDQKAKTGETANYIDPSTLLAVVPTHLYGLSSNIGFVRNTVKDDRIAIIEDAAQTFCQIDPDNDLGKMGDIAFFSLGRGKALTAVEGGVIVTNNDEIGTRLEYAVNSIGKTSLWHTCRQLFYAISISLLVRPELFWIPKALPFLRLGETLYCPDFTIGSFSPFQAGLTRRWQNKLQRSQTRRGENVRYWQHMLPGEQFFHYHYNGKSAENAIRYPIRVKDGVLRKSILKQSEKKGLGIMPAYPSGIDRIDGLRDKFNGIHFSGAHQIAEELITMPVHEYITDNDLEEIATLLNTELCRKI